MTIFFIISTPWIRLRISEGWAELLPSLPVRARRVDLGDHGTAREPRSNRSPTGT